MALFRRQGLALCIAALLVFSVGVSLAEDAAKQEEFKEKLAENEAAQEQGEDAPKKLESKIVEEAPAAELASGTGDVSTTGICRASCPRAGPSHALAST